MPPADPDLAALCETLTELAAKATERPWEVGGPHPGTSVIVCVDGGTGFPDPSPPAYEAIALLDISTEGEPNAVSQANAAYIVAACNACPALVAEVTRLRAELAGRTPGPVDDAVKAAWERIKDFTLADGMLAGRCRTELAAVLADARRAERDWCADKCRQEMYPTHIPLTTLELERYRRAYNEGVEACVNQLAGPDAGGAT